MEMELFLKATTPLAPGNAVAALIRLEDGRYLLQQRDFKPEIFYPGHWGLFGGGIEAGEADQAAMLRELQEELGLTFRSSDLEYFSRFDFDFTCGGFEPMRRVFFSVGPLPASMMADVALGEGRAVRAFFAEEALSTLSLTPYDAFALWLHAQGAERMRKAAVV
jgi:8-oxo-dGTP pyrophosphatase MutT (NUDIX family)